MRLERVKRVLVPRPDALPTLDELRRRGHLLGMISVCTEDVPQVWDETPLGGKFDATVFSCDVGVSKPDPRIYEIACERLGSSRPSASSSATARTTSSRAPSASA